MEVPEEIMEVQEEAVMLELVGKGVVSGNWAVGV